MYGLREYSTALDISKTISAEVPFSRWIYMLQAGAQSVEPFKQLLVQIDCLSIMSMIDMIDRWYNDCVQ